LADVVPSVRYRKRLRALRRLWQSLDAFERPSASLAEAIELCIRESNEVTAALDPWRLRTIGVEVSERFRTMPTVAERRKSANGVRCVIVDDDDRFIDLVSDLLVRDGFDVVGAAGDHVQALRLVANVGPDVALIDLFLGHDSGIELISDIVRAGLAEQMFVILVSTCAEDDLYEASGLCGVDGYLPKMDLSGGAIRDLLRGNGHRRYARDDRP
jgi:CheY-like chemotaxis protein